jgi:tRNA(Ile)-lysidine synthase TilS/MesJ
LVEDFCESNDLKFFRYQVDPNKKPKKDSWEEYWRNQRMGAFNSIKIPVITGHNLDDAMETWLFSSIHGQSKLIPYNTNNVYRPFLLTHKQTLYNYAVKHDISWVEDESNKDVKFVRNRIIHNILQEVMQINAGFATVIKRKYRETYETFKN